MVLPEPVRQLECQVGGVLVLLRVGADDIALMEPQTVDGLGGARRVPLRYSSSGDGNCC